MPGNTTNYSLPYLSVGDPTASGTTVLSDAQEVDDAIRSREQNEIQLASDLYKNPQLNENGVGVLGVSIQQEIHDKWVDINEIDWVAQGLGVTASGNYGITITSGHVYQDGGRLTLSTTSKSTLVDRPEVNLTVTASGGTLGVGNWYYRVTAVTSLGETDANSASVASVTVDNSKILVSWAELVDADTYNVYRGDTAGDTSCHLIASGIATFSYEDTGAASGIASPPASNTAALANELYYLVVQDTGDYAFETTQADGQLVWQVHTNASGLVNYIEDKRITSPPVTDMLDLGDFGLSYSGDYYDVVAISGSTIIQARESTSDTYPAIGMSLRGNDNLLTKGTVTWSGWGWTPGGMLYLSDTPGDITQITPASGAQVLGVALTSTSIYFSPYERLNTSNYNYWIKNYEDDESTGVITAKGFIAGSSGVQTNSIIGAGIVTISTNGSSYHINFEANGAGSNIKFDAKNAVQILINGGTYMQFDSGYADVYASSGLRLRGSTRELSTVGGGMLVSTASGDLVLNPSDNIVVSGVKNLYFGANSYVNSTHPPVRESTLVVAASNAATWVRAQSDYICDGTADDVEIQAAIDALPSGVGGKVMLSEGTFNLSAKVAVLRSGVTIEGQGKATLLALASGVNDHVIEIGNGSTYFTGTWVRMVDIYCNGDNQSSGSGVHVYSAEDTHLVALGINSAHDHCILFEGTGSRNSAYLYVSDCYLHDAGMNIIYCFNQAYGLITGGHNVYAGTGVNYAGIATNSNGDHVINGGLFDDCYFGIRMYGSSNTSIVGFQILNADASAILLDGSSHSVSIGPGVIYQANESEAGGDCIRLDGAVENSVTGVVMDNQFSGLAVYGIHEMNGADYNTYSNNKIVDMVTSEYSIIGTHSSVVTDHDGVIEHHTALDTLTNGESGSIHTNLAAASGFALVLPQDAFPGCNFKFTVITAQQLRIDPGAAGGIYINGAKQGDSAYIHASGVGENVELIADGNGDWVAINATANWGVET